MSIVEFVSQERDRYEAILDRAIAFRDMRVPGYGRATVARARRDFHRATALWLIASTLVDKNPFPLGPTPTFHLPVHMQFGPATVYSAYQPPYHLNGHAG